MAKGAKGPCYDRSPNVGTDTSSSQPKENSIVLQGQLHATFSLTTVRRKCILLHALNDGNKLPSTLVAHLVR